MRTSEGHRSAIEDGYTCFKPEFKTHILDPVLSKLSPCQFHYCYINIFINMCWNTEKKSASTSTFDHENKLERVQLLR